VQGGQLLAARVVATIGLVCELRRCINFFERSSVKTKLNCSLVLIFVVVLTMLVSKVGKKN
jgi:hypothetical protein